MRSPCQRRNIRAIFQRFGPPSALGEPMPNEVRALLATSLNRASSRYHDIAVGSPIAKDDKAIKPSRFAINRTQSVRPRKKPPGLYRAVLLLPVAGKSRSVKWQNFRAGDGWTLCARQSILFECRPASRVILPNACLTSRFVFGDFYTILDRSISKKPKNSAIPDQPRRS